MPKEPDWQRAWHQLAQMQEQARKRWAEAFRGIGNFGDFGNLSVGVDAIMKSIQPNLAAIHGLQSAIDEAIGDGLGNALASHRELQESLLGNLTEMIAFATSATPHTMARRILTGELLEPEKTEYDRCIENVWSIHDILDCVSTNLQGVITGEDPESRWIKAENLLETALLEVRRAQQEHRQNGC